MRQAPNSPACEVIALVDKLTLSSRMPSTTSTQLRASNKRSLIPKQGGRGRCVTRIARSWGGCTAPRCPAGAPSDANTRIEQAKQTATSPARCRHRSFAVHSMCQDMQLTIRSCVQLPGPWCAHVVRDGVTMWCASRVAALARRADRGARWRRWAALAREGEHHIRKLQGSWLLCICIARNWCDGGPHCSTQSGRRPVMWGVCGRGAPARGFRSFQ
jgi:hypothetical protein